MLDLCQSTVGEFLISHQFEKGNSVLFEKCMSLSVVSSKVGSG